jgi:hypothetical protein
MRQHKIMHKIELSYLSYIRKQLQLDDFELQLLMHYTRIPIETLKRRYPHARSNMSQLLIKEAIRYKEAKGREITLG